MTTNERPLLAIRHSLNANRQTHLVYGFRKSNGLFVPNKAICGKMAPIFVAEVTLEQVKENSPYFNFCPECRKKILNGEKEDPEKTMTVAGHNFRLKDIQFGLHSEETCDFTATLVCDGEVIGTVENEGHGGPTDFCAAAGTDTAKIRQILDAVRKSVWIRCMNGSIMYHDFGTIADKLLMLEDAPTPYRDKNGTPVWISTTPDNEENRGGLYVQIYNYPSEDCQVDYHRIDARTVGQGQKTFTKALQEYISKQDYL